jgi:DNA-binding response OmpR family regulator
MEQPLNILLIEDNPGDAFLIKFYLEDSVLRNAHITHAEYLKSAIDLLSKNAYDLIILDFNLPDSVGIETLQAILDVKKDAVVIVLTGLQDEELGIQTVKMGAQDFLVKGQFDGKVFTQSIRYAFERSQIRREIKKYADDLHRTEFRLDVVQRLTNAAFWRVIIDDRSVAATQYFEEITSSNKPIETINDFEALFHVNDIPKVVKAINDAIHNKTGFTLDAKLHNGKQITLEAVNTYIDKVNIQVLAGVLKLPS